MAQSDFAEVAGSASTSSITRGVSSSFTPPSGGGGNVFAFESQDNGTGAVALYATLAGANPTTKGAQISAAVQRGPSAGATSFAPFLFLQLTNPNAQGVAYLLGLGDGGHVLLRKGDLASGLPDVAPGTEGVLARSTSTELPMTWQHLLLEAIVNQDGDVVLNAYESDLTAHAVGSPVWTAIPGLASVVDDVLGVNTGSAPLTAGRLGFGFWSSDVARVGLFDAVRPTRHA